MFRKLLLVGLVSLCVLAFAVPTLAQADEFLYGVRENQLVQMNATGQAQVIAAVAQRYGELVASPDGRYLAFAAYDTEYARTLVVYDRVSDEFFTVASSISFGVPFSFTQNNELVYAVDGAFVTNAEGREVMQLQVHIQPLPMTDAPTIIPVEYGVGCGGGSPLPTSNLYSSETYSLGGSHLVLALTPFGLVYSADCTGGRTVVQSLEEATVSIYDLSRAIISPDGTCVAGIAMRLNEPTPLEISVLDLTNDNLTTFTVDATPDQLAWNATGSGIFYSVRAFDTLLNYEGEALSRIEAVLGEGTALERYTVNLFALDLSSGTNSLIYNGDGYAIGRILPTDSGVYFSVVPNIDAWTNAIADGSFDPFTATEAESDALMPITIWRAALDASAAQPVASDLRSAAVLVPRG
ncbi:MAG: hypothetical protein SF123_17715 [Chloroflexota bacterium]|nr:hypothetical protein [Chloroflexota bacterium]